MLKQLSCYHGDHGLRESQAAASETLDLHFCVLRCCRIQASSLTSDLAGEGQCVQQCKLSIEHLCWSLPSQLRGRREKLSFLILSPGTGGRLSSFPGEASHHLPSKHCLCLFQHNSFPFYKQCGLFPNSAQKMCFLS